MGIFSQVFPPEPAALGQQLADVARELAGRGHSVTVLTSDRGYDNPEERYVLTEERDGASVRRFPWCSFGKGSVASRLLGGLSFTVRRHLRVACCDGGTT